MTDDPKLQMARQACASACEDPAWRPEIIAGKCDDWLGVRAALAAIEECTERAARLIEATQPLYSDQGQLLRPRYEGSRDGLPYASALRSGDHLKGPTA